MIGLGSDKNRTKLLLLQKLLPTGKVALLQALLILQFAKEKSWTIAVVLNLLAQAFKACFARIETKT